MSYDIESLTTPLRVARKIVETKSAVSLVFEVPADKQAAFRFGPGQYLTLFLEIEGERVARSYSISSSPAMDRELQVTVKRVPGGRGSNFIVDRVREGDQIRVSPPAGHFFRPPATSGPHHWALFAVGSGITPIFSILKTVLLTEPGAIVTLVYGNRDQTEIIYDQLLKELETKYAARFKVIHVLSQPIEPWAGNRGRCQGETLRRIVTEVLARGPKNIESFLCGPDEFMNSVRAELQNSGIGAAQIHQESFTTTHSAPRVDSGPPGRVYIGDKAAPRASGTSELRALINGEESRVELKPDQSILDGLLESGANAPYSCLEGQCMACMAKIKKGLVYQDDPGILMPENMAEGEVLTCQARAVSSQVEIDFDL
jgi:ring-1,2-phenylacetyl-CoA epoxidase subunit PaaE